jgi:hypothetical protein
VENVGVGLGTPEKSSIDKSLVAFIVSLIVGRYTRGESLALGLEAFLFSSSLFTFAFPSRETDLLSIVFKPLSLLCIVFSLGFCCSWLPQGKETNKVEINTISAKVNIVAFIGVGFIKRNLKGNNISWIIQ